MNSNLTGSNPPNNPQRIGSSDVWNQHSFENFFRNFILMPYVIILSEIHLKIPH